VKLDLGQSQKDQAIHTMELYTAAFNRTSDWAFHNRESNKVKVHKGTYYDVRELVPELPATLVESARDVVCEAIKGNDCRRPPRRRTYGAMRYSYKASDIFLDKGIISLCAAGGRIRARFSLPEYFQKYRSWGYKGGVLTYAKKKDEFYFGIVVWKDPPIEGAKGEMVGIDRGLKNAAVSSGNDFFSASKIRNIKGKFARLRAELQAKGTRSAKRLLRRMAGRERRFVACENHSMTKQLVNSEYASFAVEDLGGIANKDVYQSRMSRRLHNWSHWRFQWSLRYKAEEQGKAMVIVNPWRTSITCSKCLHVDSASRNRSVFKCTSCGFELNADLNAARNIARIGTSDLGRLPVREPHATHRKAGNHLSEEGCSCESKNAESFLDYGHLEFRDTGGSFVIDRFKCFQNPLGGGLEE
jgi:IS605 OrfB family transposase